MSTIFISHSSRDNAFAERLGDFLKAQEYEVFLDFDREVGIAAGQPWEQELYVRLRQCSAVVVLWSAHAVDSKWCFVEMSHARALGKYLFPIKVDDCTEKPPFDDVQIIDATSETWDGACTRLKKGLLEAGLDPRDLFVWKNSRLPYPGLRAFEEADAAVFFGRGKEIQEGLDLLSRLQRFGGARMALILGASGSGKSSLMRAGLLPRLKRRPESWLVVEPFRPRGKPLVGLAKALALTFSTYGRQKEVAQVRDLLEEAAAGGDLRGVEALFEELRVAAGQLEATVLISIDQFEELLGAGTTDEHAQVVVLLRRLAEGEGGRKMLLGTLRSDFLGIFQQHAALQDLAFEDLPVGPMPMESVGEVIEKPADLAGLTLEAGLTQRILQEMQTPNALPLLAFTLKELYERYGHSGTLTIGHYTEGLGGLHGAITKRADEVLRAHVKKTGRGKISENGITLAAKDARPLKSAFLEMVRINEEGLYARQPVRVDELTALGVPTGKESLLQQLVEARLLVRGEEPPVLEVAHEALFQVWPLLAKWLEDSRKFLLWRRRLRFMIEQWEQHGQDKAYLLVRRQLAEARRWLRDRSYRLNNAERTFIKESIHAAGLRKSIVRYLLKKAPQLVNQASSEIACSWFITLVRAGLAEQAIEAAQRIEAPSSKAEVLSSVAQALAQAGLAEQARHAAKQAIEVAHQVTDISLQSDIYADATQVLAQLHAFRDAYKAADRARIPDDQLGAYAMILEEYVKKHGPDKVKQSTLQNASSD